MSDSSRGADTGGQCPPWCREHPHGLTPGDDQHQSFVQSVPVVERILRIDDDAVVPGSVATTFDVVRHRDTVDTTEWVFVGDDDLQMDLTLASARSLVDALQRAIGV